MIRRVTKLFREYPPQFWMLSGTAFIDTIGSTILFPFFTLYITRHFGLGITQAGILLGLYNIMGMLGSTLGGALADKFGRKPIIVFGLLSSGLGSLVLAFVDSIALFYPVLILVGSVSHIGGPARQAMIADILPEEQRADGFGLFRVIHNLAWVVGPGIGGLLAARSYMLLFFSDAVMSSLTAILIFRLIRETVHQNGDKEKREGIFHSMKGYAVVFKNRLFMIFLFVVVLMVLVYSQLYTTLSVYLRDSHGVADSGYGMLMSLNALLVVILQLWVTKRVKKHNPFLMMALGTCFYLVGYTMIGFVHAYLLFIVAAVLITFGEMITMPIQQALVAEISPKEMRGRYMAVSGLSYSLPSVISTWAAGLIMDNSNPDYLWYLCGILSLFAVFGFLLLYSKTGTGRS